MEFSIHPKDIVGFCRNRIAGPLFSSALIALGLSFFNANTARAQNGQSFIDIAKLVQQPFVDQHDRLHPLTFPSDRITVLTLNGQAGKEMVADWAQPLHDEFGENLRFYCVADLRAVPKFMRGQIKEKFQRTMRIPLILDFTGSIASLVPNDPDSVTIVVFGQRGETLYANSGEASSREISQIKNIIRSGLLAQN